MKQVVIPKTGDPSVLKTREIPTPEPGPGEVRIKVAAAGINFSDLMARMGLYPDAPPLPAVMGYEVSGVIEALGEGADPGRMGQRVAALTRFGGQSTHVCVPGYQAIEIPDHLDHVTAASIPVVGLTSWMMLEQMGRVREGDRVLVHAAGGSVGLMALDLIKRRGATAVGTASASKHDFLKERGYEKLVDYRTQDFESVLKDGPGFDLILDAVGGESWAKGMRLLRPAGRLVAFGFSANATGKKRSILKVMKNMMAVPWIQTSPIALINANKGVLGVNMGGLWHVGREVAGWMVDLMACVDRGEVRPLVHAALPFSEAARAHEILHNRENLGKVVLIPD